LQLRVSKEITVTGTRESLDNIIKLKKENARPTIANITKLLLKFLSGREDEPVCTRHQLHWSYE
jgi:hypothetical protein